MCVATVLRSAVLAFSSVLTIVLASCTHPPEPSLPPPGDWPALVHALTRSIEHEMDAADVVGLSIAIVEPEGVRWSRGFGFADRERQQPATDQTIYRVGSMSKPVTAAVLMTLVEQGRLDLDAPLETYLPDFAIRSRFEDAGPVTLRGILTHRSGLPNLWHKTAPDDRPVPYNQLVHEMARAALAYPPGLVSKYSSLGFDLAGHAAEVVAGRPFVELADDFLSTLGASTASFDPSESAMRLLALPYRKGRPVSELPELDGEIPSGGLHTSVLDYAQFSRLFLGTSDHDGAGALSPSSVREMLAVEPPSPLDFENLHGLGWSRWAPEGLGYAGSFASHGGATVLYRCLAVLSLDHDVGVVVCANTQESGQAVFRVATEAVRLALELKGIRAPSEDEEPAPLQPVAESEAFEGRYQSIVGVLDVTVGHRIEARLLGRRVRLIDEGGDWYSPRYLLLGSIPLKVGGMGDVRFGFADVAGRRVIVREQLGHRSRFADRIEPSPIHPAWRDRVGKYDLTNARLAEISFRSSPNVEVEIDDGTLVLRFYPNLQPAIELTWAMRTLSDDEAVCQGLVDFLGGETLRATEVGGRERITMWGYEFERIEG